jgi:ribosomal protein S8
MSKNAMKIIATLSTNCKANVLKVSGEEGYIHVIKVLFELVTTGIIYELLMRLRKYYEIDKIVISQSKFVLKEKEFKQLQPYFKEYVAIWNQLERLRIHLVA